MSSTTFGKKFWVGSALAGVALVVMLAAGEPAQGDAASPALGGAPVAQGGALQAGARDQAPPSVTGAAPRGEARQALAGLVQIRQRQCQMGNQLACQVLPEMPAQEQKLAKLEAACQSGDCGEYNAFAQKIVTAYSESAAVMRAGDAGMAQMDAWRAQMNRNAAGSMAALQAQGAAGQAAHQARQESYAAMNRSWDAQQASSDRTQGRTIDRIYEGTTMHGGGVQSRIDYGSTGYTDGRGNVVAVPNGGRAPDGWEEMQPTYAAPR
jgi:hypothetical protein